MKLYIEKNNVLYPVDIEHLISIIDLRVYMRANEQEYQEEIELCLDVLAEREASKNRQ